ncbi:helix-turn-helix domain-containing protein [Staphylococcus xylosus]
MELDKTLKGLRKDKGITQEYLAKEIYVSVQTINKWENGKCLPDAINLLNLANFYKISLDKLMKNEISKNLKKDKVSILNKVISQITFWYKKKT